MRLSAEREREIRARLDVISKGGPIRWNKSAITDFNALLDEVSALRSDLNCRGIHTCHEKCQNWICLMRKERDALLAEREQWGNEFNAVIIVKEERDRLIQECERQTKVYLKDQASIARLKALLEEVAEAFSGWSNDDRVTAIRRIKEALK